MRFLQEKLKKLLLGKYYGEFKNLFKGTGIEIQDFKQYQIGDDTRHINWKISSKYDELFVNVIGHHKDATIDVFFDINRNWLGGNIQTNKDKVFELFTDIFVYSKKYGANINSYFYLDSKISYQKIKKESDVFLLFSLIDKQLKKSAYNYFSNLARFLNNQKNISKRHVIIIFSDFLGINEMIVKTIKTLNIKNEIFLFKLNIEKIQGINYDLFDIVLENNYNIKLKYINLL